MRFVLPALLFMLAHFSGLAQAIQPACYSTGSNTYQVTQPSPQLSGSSNVTAASNGSDGYFTTYTRREVICERVAGKVLHLCHERGIDRFGAPALAAVAKATA